MSLTSTCFQALEDVNLKYNPVLQDVLYYMDRIFTVIFFLEMCVKWLALGFVKYFTNAWCWLDFVIVMVRQLQLVSQSKIRTLCVPRFAYIPHFVPLPLREREAWRIDSHDMKPSGAAFSVLPGERDCGRPRVFRHAGF